MPDFQDRWPFLRVSVAFEGALLLVAIALGWLTGIDPLRHLRFDRASLIEGTLGGIVATLPLFLGYLVSRRMPLRPLQEIRSFLLGFLGAPLSQCRWYELLLLGLIAGLGEEVLFRGTLQPWLERYGDWTGLIVCNVLFGLAHAVTKTYAVIAGLIGVYLSLILDATPERNLLTPILVHGLYDALAFGVIAREYRQLRSAGRIPTVGDPV